MGVTYWSARHSLDRLIDAGILRQVGDASYGKVYVADEIVSIVGERSEQRIVR